MKHSEAIDSLAEALAKAQGQMGGALKASANPFFKSKYADLKSVWEACRTPLSENGLSIAQTARCEYAGGAAKEVAALAAAVSEKTQPPAVIVTTILMHASGQWIEEELQMWPRENTPQGIGSCISYARRYALAAMVGVYQEDDDAERAHGRREDTEHVSMHDEAEMMSQMQDLVNALKDNNAVRARMLWTEFNTVGSVGAIWKALNTKQKKSIRDLLQQTAPAEAETPAEEPHE